MDNWGQEYHTRLSPNMTEGVLSHLNNHKKGTKFRSLYSEEYFNFIVCDVVLKMFRGGEVVKGSSPWSEYYRPSIDPASLEIINHILDIRMEQFVEFIETPLEDKPLYLNDGIVLIRELASIFLRDGYGIR